MFKSVPLPWKVTGLTHRQTDTAFYSLGYSDTIPVKDPSIPLLGVSPEPEPEPGRKELSSPVSWAVAATRDWR